MNNTAALEIEGVVKFCKGDSSVFTSCPGPQTKALLSEATETLFGGGRGAGRTTYLMARAIMGSAELPMSDRARCSYLNDPGYVGVLITPDKWSREELFERAIDLYGNFGCRIDKSGMRLTFASGAKVCFDHLKSGADSLRLKYVGINVSFLGIDEIGEIATEREYLRIVGIVKSGGRSVNGSALRPLPCRIALTAHPNEFALGTKWVIDRFRLADKKTYGQIAIDPITNLSRLYIAGTVHDNPHLMNTPYPAMLAEIEKHATTA